MALSALVAGLRVLVADPDPTIRAAAKSQLMRSGFDRILEASTMRQAADVIRLQRPHLVITNVSFPDGSGASLLQQARRAADSSELPFVLLAASATDAVASRAAGLARCALLVSPFTPEQLRDVVTRVLDTSVAASAEAGAESGEEPGIPPGTEPEPPAEPNQPAEADTGHESEPVLRAELPADNILAICEDGGGERDIDPLKLITLPGYEKLRVLVLDGNVLHRTQIEGLLRELGFENVTGTDSGATALKRAETGRIDYLLCECLPADIGPSGFDILRAVRANELTNSLPVVMLTATAEKENVLRALRLKADDYLLKPISLRLLADSFNRVLHQEELNRRSGNTYKGICLNDEAAIATAQQLVRNASSGQSDETRQLESLRILLVDEDEKFRCICSTLLRRMGFRRVMETSSGASASKKIEHGLVDIVFCEWFVVGVSGLEIVRSVRSVDFLRSVPFIMLTEVASKEAVMSALRAGVTDFVLKPCSVETLAESLARVLTSQRAVPKAPIELERAVLPP